MQEEKKKSKKKSRLIFWVGGAIGGWAEGVRGHAVNRAGLRFFYSSLTDRCFSRHISTASILNSLPKRERENSEWDVSLLVQRSHQRQRPLRRRMKERIFLKPSPGKKTPSKNNM